MLNDYSFNKLNLSSHPKEFDCKDSDLNEFFLKDAYGHYKQLLTVTYYYESLTETVAYFSVLNDKIINKDKDNKTISRPLKKNIPFEKQRQTYPSVKVGRLGVHAKHQSQDIGSQILTFIKGFFSYNNKTGCRFITVDAYNSEKVKNFYIKNRFKFLIAKDEGEETRLMYFDLMTFVR